MTFDRNNVSVKTGDHVILCSGRRGIVVDIETPDEVTVLVDGDEEMVPVAQLELVR